MLASPVASVWAMPATMAVAVNRKSPFAGLAYLCRAWPASQGRGRRSYAAPMQFSVIAGLAHACCTQSAVSGRASALCMQLSTPFFYYRYHAEDAWGRRACYKLSKSSRVHDARMGFVTSAYLTEKAPGGGRLSQCRLGSALQLPGWRPPAEAGPPICTHGRSSHMRGSQAHPGLLWLTMVPRCLSKAQERERETHVMMGSC